MPAYTPEGFDFDGEVTQGTNLVKGAKAAGVRQFVQTSVAGAGQDIGAAATAAVLAPERFNGIELELASDYLSMTQIAEVLSRVLGTPLSAPDMTEEEALAAGMPAMGAALEWLNVAGQPCRPSTHATSAYR
jgi:uncharacterized protein YbjT (DUF2867 family)